jgi:hypothetical protein
MSGEHAKNEKATSGEKIEPSGAKHKGKTSSREKEPSGDKHKHEERKEKSTGSDKSHKKDGKKKKKMKKVVFYETDSSAPSTSDAKSISSKHHKDKKSNKIPFHYPRISRHANLISVPLGKPPHFDGEDYSMLSEKMRNHLTSLHESIWDIVEFGAQGPQVGEEGYDSDDAAQIRRFNSQATTILFASLCREEYNKVQGLKSAKEIWDVLKTAHEGDRVTKITKRETIEGELGRFTLNKGEEPQAMYNQLKTMVNQVRNLGSTKWDDHEVVNLILRSLVFRNPTQVQLIRESRRYEKMSHEEVIGKFVSFELMVKDSKHIANLEQGAASTIEPQPVALKATEEKKEETTPSKGPQIDTSKLDNEEMALIIKSFRQILRQRKGKDHKSHSKRVCYRCGKSGHYIAKCPYASDSDRDEDKKGKKKMEKKKYYHKNKGGEAHVVREWDSDESSTDSDSNEDTANIAVNKRLLFPNIGNKCLMAKEGKRKVTPRTTPKYTTSDDEGDSSDDKEELTLLFQGLSKRQIDKINELVTSINEKNDVLECQEALFTKEHDKYVKLEKALAHEKEKCKNLTNELKTCNDSISCLKSENINLIAKIEELHDCPASTSTIEHVTNCTRCRDVDVDAISDHLALIKNQNDHIVKLDAKIAEHELENEKFKFARSMLYKGRRPSIKDGVGFQHGSQDREGYILYPKNYPEHNIRRIHARQSHSIAHQAYIYKNEASSSRLHTSHAKVGKMPKKKIIDASNEPKLSFKTFDASYVLTSKSGRVVPKYVGGRHKSPKTCVWVSKVLISNVKGPKTIWVPKDKA